MHLRASSLAKHGRKLHHHTTKWCRADGCADSENGRKGGGNVLGWLGITSDSPLRYYNSLLCSWQLTVPSSHLCSIC